MRILIAEDERITRTSLARQLERWGHSVTSAEDGQEAWDRFEAGEFDIVITDWEMPRLSGLDLIRKIRGVADATYVYVIMLTSRSEKSDIISGIEAGADDYVSKPFDRDELRVRVLAGERVINLERHLADRSQKLQAANELMHRDLRAAAKVQQELLPKKLPEVSPLRFAWRYRPCEELGGDLLNVVQINDNQIAMYLADVSGHGVAASLVSVSVHRSLSVRKDPSSLIVDGGDGPGPALATSPGEVADRLNGLYQMESIGGHFMTLVYATLDLDSMEFRYSAAGHPGPTLARPDEHVRPFETQGLPIGVAAEVEFETTTTILESGDRLYLFSDGLMEAMNPANEMFGRSRIEKVIDETRHRTIDESIDALISEAEAWQGSDRFSDDLSLLALEVQNQ